MIDRTHILFAQRRELDPRMDYIGAYKSRQAALSAAHLMGALPNGLDFVIYEAVPAFYRTEDGALLPRGAEG